MPYEFENDAAAPIGLAAFVFSNDPAVPIGTEAELYWNDGALLLQAGMDWHYLRAATDGAGKTTIEIDQDPVAHPGGSIRAFAVLDVSGTGYSLGLALDGKVTLDIGQTASGEAGDAALALKSNNGSYYNLTLYRENGKTGYEIAQTPN